MKNIDSVMILGNKEKKHGQGERAGGLFWLSLWVFLTGFLLAPGNTLNAEPIYWTDGVTEAEGWIDTNKTGDGDTNLCWAAASANVLDYTNLDGDAFNPISGDTIFTEFRDHWTDEAGSPRCGIEWWFTGNNPEADIPEEKPTGYAQVDVPGGGNNYDQASLDRKFSWTGDNLVNSIIAGLQADAGVIIRVAHMVANPDPPPPDQVERGHFLTTWGIDAGTEDIWITDSDDGSTRLVKLSLSGLTFNDIDGEEHDYEGWYITHVYRLIPEPVTILLFGGGLGMFGFIRRPRPA